MSDARQSITQILNEVQERGEATQKLFPLVYAELRRIGGALLSNERPGYTLSATELVNEAYLRLFDSDAVAWANRRHFFGAAAKAMRRILVDRARYNDAQKRIPKENLDEIGAAISVGFSESPDELMAIDQALEALASIDPRRVQIVEMRYFLGLTEQEISELLNVSRATVTREWRGARRWLRAELS